MTTDLQQLFTDVSQSTDQVLKKIQPYDHPLLTLLRETLQKQHETLLPLLRVLQQENELPPIESIKEYCSVTYHANEVAHSFFQSWVRAADWMKLPSQAIAPEVTSLMNQAKESLGEAAKEMEDVYGFEKIKYVIPTFYLPALP